MGHLPIIQVGELPSRFLPYPEGTKIFYRPFTYGEILQLAQSNLSDIELARKIILPGVEVEGIDKEDLIFADFAFITILRYMSSFPSYEFQVSGRCGNKECNEKIFKSVRATEIEFADLDVPDLPVIVEVAGEELHFMPLTLKARFNCEEKYDINNSVHVLAHLVVNKPVDEVIDILENRITAEEAELIEEVDKMLALHIKPVVIKCPKCSRENYIRISIGGTLRPFRRYKEPAKDRIRFGISRNNKPEGHKGSRHG